MDMLIYTPQITKRMEYIVDFVFVHYFGVAYTLTDNFELFRQHDAPKIIYADRVIEEEIQIIATPLLTQTNIQTQPIPTTTYQSVSCPFAVKETNTLFPFDVFSAIFYLITRYEEYLPFTPNKYGQFPAKEAFAFKHHFLQQPVIDSWLNDLKDKLQRLYPGFTCKEKIFTPVITYDIEIPLA
jgi:hypothetical protein